MRLLATTLVLTRASALLNPPHAASLSYYSTTRLMARKPGVSDPSDLVAHVALGNVRVVDARSIDYTVEPGDEKTNDYAPIAGTVPGVRPNAVNLPFDRVNKNLDLAPLEDVPKDTPIITHCGGGGRGQKAKDYLLANGFTNVLNGGGPEDKECWEIFGEL